jgi:thioesterase domain-containing protein
MNAEQCEKSLLTDIAIAKAMEISVLEFSDDKIKLGAPLKANFNHKSTAFGGSIHSLAVMACLSLITHRLEGENIDYIVLQKSQIDYLKPILANFTAEAEIPDESHWGRFLKTLKKKGLARVSVNARICSQGVECGYLKSVFVAAHKIHL